MPRSLAQDLVVQGQSNADDGRTGVEGEHGTGPVGRGDFRAAAVRHAGMSIRPERGWGGRYTPAAMAGAGELTPMLRHYLELKSQYSAAVLLYRMGDFYEMFFEDAQLAAPLLDLTLTARHRGT